MACQPLTWLRRPDASGSAATPSQRAAPGEVSAATAKARLKIGVAARLYQACERSLPYKCRALITLHGMVVFWIAVGLGIAGSIIAWSMVQDQARETAHDAFISETDSLSRRVQEVMYDVLHAVGTVADVTAASAPALDATAFQTLTSSLIRGIPAMHAEPASDLVFAPLVESDNRAEWEAAVDDSTGIPGHKIKLPGPGEPIVPVPENASAVYAPMLMLGLCRHTNAQDPYGLSGAVMGDLLADNSSRTAVVRQAVASGKAVLSASWQHPNWPHTSILAAAPVLVDARIMNSSVGFLRGASQVDARANFPGRLPGDELPRVNRTPLPVGVILTAVHANAVIRSGLAGIAAPLRTRLVALQDITDHRILSTLAPWRIANRPAYTVDCSNATLAAVLLQSLPQHLSRGVLDAPYLAAASVDQYGVSIEQPTPDVATQFISLLDVDTAVVAQVAFAIGERVFLLSSGTSPDFFASADSYAAAFLGLGLGLSVFVATLFYVASLKWERARERRHAETATRVTAMLAVLHQHETILRWVSHALRNPAHIISACAAFIERALPPEHQSQADVRAIRDSTAAITRLLCDIANYYKLQGEVLETKHHVVDIRALISGIVRRLAIARDTASAYHVRAGTDVPKLMIIDQTRLTEVLQAFITNFLPEGGLVRVEFRRDSSSTAASQKLTRDDGSLAPAAKECGLAALLGSGMRSLVTADVQGRLVITLCSCSAQSRQQRDAVSELLAPLGADSVSVAQELVRRHSTKSLLALEQMAVDGRVVWQDAGFHSGATVARLSPMQVSTRGMTDTPAVADEHGGRISVETSDTGAFHSFEAARQAATGACMTPSGRGARGQMAQSRTSSPRKSPLCRGKSERRLSAAIAPQQSFSPSSTARLVLPEDGDDIADMNDVVFLPHAISSATPTVAAVRTPAHMNGAGAPLAGELVQARARSTSTTAGTGSRSARAPIDEHIAAPDYAASVRVNRTTVKVARKVLECLGGSIDVARTPADERGWSGIVDIMIPLMPAGVANDIVMAATSSLDVRTAAIDVEAGGAPGCASPGGSSVATTAQAVDHTGAANMNAVAQGGLAGINEWVARAAGSRNRDSFSGGATASTARARSPGRRGSPAGALRTMDVLDILLKHNAEFPRSPHQEQQLLLDFVSEETARVLGAPSTDANAAGLPPSFPASGSSRHRRRRSITAAVSHDSSDKGTASPAAAPAADASKFPTVMVTSRHSQLGAGPDAASAHGANSRSTVDGLPIADHSSSGTVTSQHDATPCLAMSTGLPRPTRLRASLTAHSTADEVTSSLHCLYADDDHINRRLMQRMLQSLGCTCDVVPEGDDAIDALEIAGNLRPTKESNARARESSVARRPYDILFLDIVMQRTDGMQICKEVQGRGLRIPVFAATANAHSRANISDAGFLAVLEKPFGLPALQAALKAAAPHIAAHATASPAADSDGATAPRAADRPAARGPLAVTSAPRSPLTSAAVL